MRMRTGFFISVLGLVCVLWVLPLSYSAESKPPSPELIQKGENLFLNAKPLGVKYACILCHKGEKAIEHAKVLKLGDQLPDVINDHILKKSKGKPIAKDSEEMKALEAYITHKHSV